MAVFFIAFVCRRLADLNLPRRHRRLKTIRNNMSQKEIASFLHVLTSEYHTQQGAAWGKFLFNVEQARALGPLEKPVAVQIIEAGVSGRLHLAGRHPGLVSGCTN